MEAGNILTSWPIVSLNKGFAFQSYMMIMMSLETNIDAIAVMKTPNMKWPED
jgi:hypothetical protein